MSNMGFQEIWAWVSLSCVALGTSLSFCSEPHFPPLDTGTITYATQRAVGRHSEEGDSGRYTT